MVRPCRLADASPALEPPLKLVDGLLGAQNQTPLPTYIQTVVGGALRQARDLHDIPLTLRLVIT